ncbi:MAG: glycosyltransferase family 39 protein [Gemmatimonadaceae bacterium]|nr:glycosyltransferase family 39 protein [Gemmatimonadaceae bacterium]
MFPALCGVFLVGIGYLLARVLFSDSTAEWVALLLALSPIQVNWSRSEYLDVAMTLFMALSFLFAMWPEVVARRSSRPEVATLSGLCAGLALACKWSAIVLIPFPLAVVLFLHVRSVENSLRAPLLSGVTFCLFATLASFCILSLDSFRWAYSPPAGAPYGVPGFPRTPFAMVQGLSAIPLAELQRQAIGFTLNWAGPLFPLVFAILLLARRPVRSRTVEVVRTDARKGTLLILLASTPAFVLVQGGELNTWRAFYPVFVCILASGHLFDSLDRRKRFGLGAMVCVTMIPFTVSYGLRVGPSLTGYFGSELRYSRHLPNGPPMRWVANPDGKEALIPTNFIFQRRKN